LTFLLVVEVLPWYREMMKRFDWLLVALQKELKKGPTKEAAHIFCHL